jgi:NAD+ kinase
MSSYRPWGSNGLLPDVVVVQKKTALERYSAELKTEAARTFFLKDGQTDDNLQSTHNRHCQTLDSLLTFLTRQSLSFSLHTLDDFTQYQGYGPTHYLAGQESGLRCKLNLVICVGGDGTLLRSSHFAGGQTAMVGINSVPLHSVGHLCSISPDDLEVKLAHILNGQTAPCEVRRLVARTNQGLQLPYALNDIYFGHQHPASASRYTLTLEGPQHRTEKQLSSGLWLATPAGSTAAIRSYGLGVLDPGSHQFLLAVREPYTHPGHHLSLTRLVLDGDSQSVTLFSRMRHGLVCVDGPVTACVLGFGDSLEVGLHEEGSLRIFLN